MSYKILQPHSHDKQFKYPYVFLGLYLVCLLSTVCLANRITQLGTFIEPGGIFLFPFTFTICDIVGEVYGYSYPRLFIWIGVGAELIFAAAVTAVSHLPSPVFLKHPEAYQTVFDPTTRYVFAGVVALLVGEFANAYLLTKWKIFLRGKYFIFRSLVSTAFGQACLTVIVDLLNYLGKMSSSDFMWMMFCGYFWKMCFAVLMVFPAWLLVGYLKKVEGVDHYDINTNFNPFVLSLNDEFNRSAQSIMST